VKLITQLVEYLRSRGALTQVQVSRLAGKGFIDLPREADSSPLLAQDPEEKDYLEWEAAELAAASHPVRRRRGRKAERAEAEKAEELAGRLAEQLESWEGELQTLTAVAEAFAPCSGWREAADHICKAAARDLAEALAEAMRSNTLSASQLWQALHFEAYRGALEGLSGPPRKAYRALLTGRHVSELTGYAWLLKYEEPAAVYRLIRAQKALAAALRTVYRVMPERVRRGLHETEHGRPLTLLEAARWLPAERRRLDGRSARYYVLQPQRESWWRAWSVALQIDPDGAGALLSHCRTDPFVPVPAGQVPGELWRFTVGEQEWCGRGGDETLVQAIATVVTPADPSGNTVQAALQHPYPLVRWYAVEEGQRVNGSLLGAVLDDPEWEIAFQAASRLQETSWAATDEPLRAQLAQALPRLVAGAGANFAKRSTLLGLVEKLGPLSAASVPVLATWASDPDKEARTRLAQGLGSVTGTPKEVVPVLLRLLADRAWGVASAAIMALGKLGPEAEAAVPELVQVLATGDPVLRSSAAWALGSIGRPVQKVLPALVQATGSPFAMVRRAAVEALARLGAAAEAAISLIAGCLKDVDWSVRRAAVIALPAFGPLSASVVAALVRTLIEDADKDVWNEAAGVLEAVPPLHLLPQLPQLLCRLEGPEESGRPQRVGTVLGPLRDNPQEAIRGYLKVLRGNGEAAAVAAADLRQAADVAGALVPRLMEMALARPDVGAGREALLLVDRVGKLAVAIVASLVCARDRGKARVQQDAAKALACLGQTTDRLLPWVIRAIRSRRPPVRRAARRLLARLAPFVAVAPVRNRPSKQRRNEKPT
jgi:HEAT repeat protein